MTIAVPCAHASAAGRLRCRGSVLEAASRPGSVPKPVRQTSRETQLVQGCGGLPSGGAGLSQPLSSPELCAVRGPTLGSTGCQYPLRGG